MSKAQLQICSRTSSSTFRLWILYRVSGAVMKHKQNPQVLFSQPPARLLCHMKISASSSTSSLKYSLYTVHIYI